MRIVVPKYSDFSTLLKKALLIMLLFFAIGLRTYGQSVFIPDGNLVRKLSADYPQVMQGTQLNTAVASNFTGQLLLSASNISNAFGIQYFKKIAALDLSNNSLTSIQDISSLQNLEVIKLENNPLYSLPDFSSFQKLKELYVAKTSIDTIKGIAALNLEVLSAGDNKIRNLTFLNNNTALKTLLVYNNELRELPILSNKSAIVTVDIANNNLTFEDLLPLKSHPNFQNITYSPQKITYSGEAEVAEKNSYWITVPFDDMVKGCRYEWYRNNNLVTQNGNRIFPINSVAVSDSGIYRVRISNDGLDGFFLETTFKLNVRECITLASAFLNVIDEHCIDGYNIGFTNVQVKNAQFPLTYAIVNSIGDTVYSQTAGFTKIIPGDTKFIIWDGKKCSVEKKFTLARPADCAAAFSPNDDGVMDSYYINETGKIEIFDKNRILIQSFTGPVLWEGTKSNGEKADAGLYAVVINEKKVIHITLIR